jgi:L-methionine (R)-S-oxide reductase
VDIVAEIRAAKEPSEALGCVVRRFAADTGTLHLLGDDGLLHLKELIGDFPPPVLRGRRGATIRWRVSTQASL